MRNPTLKNYEDLKRRKQACSVDREQQPELQTSARCSSVTQWTESKTLPLLMCLRPALVCICKYSISDICCLIFKSDQDTTAAEAIHKEAHIFVLLLFFFVGMELVLTKPTKPTCKFMHWIKGYLSFFVLFITGMYDGVQDHKQREKTTKKGNGRQTRKRDEERMKSKDKWQSEEETDEGLIRQHDSGRVILELLRVWCDRYRWILLRCATIMTVSELCVVGFHVVCSLSVWNKDPRQSLGHTSMFVGTRSADWLKFFFCVFFSFAFLQKRVPDRVATIIIIIII